MNSQSKQRKVLLAVCMVIILSAPLLFINCSKKKVTGKKQVILICIDTLRGDHLSSYGYARDTSPKLSGLINDSVYYVNAYSNGCWTFPSHITLFTGTLPSRHGVNLDMGYLMEGKYAKLSDSMKTMAEVLKAQKMKTIKYAFLPDEIGFARGFETNYLIDPFLNEKMFDKLLKEIVDNKDENFFLFIHTWMVHAPYTNSFYLKEGKVGEEKRHYIDNFRELFGKFSKMDEQGMVGKAHTFVKTIVGFESFLKENHLFNLDDCVDLYDSGIKNVDQYIGRIIEKSREIGIYDDAMFIVVSDHGEHFGEHLPEIFYDFHGRDHYEEFIKIPIIIKYPHKFKVQTVKDPVSLVDVFPTVLDYYEIDIPAYVQGRSLLKESPGKDRTLIIGEATFERNIEKKMIRLGDLKYTITMENPSKPERVNWDSITERSLYDLKKDPLEKNDLYPNPKFRNLAIELEKMLIQIVKNSAKMNLSTEKVKLSRESKELLESLGYL